MTDDEDESGQRSFRETPETVTVFDVGDDEDEDGDEGRMTETEEDEDAWGDLGRQADQWGQEEDVPSYEDDVEKGFSR